MDNSIWLAYGMDAEQCLALCGGNHTAFQTILKLYRNHACFQNAEAAFAEKDYQKLYDCIHELKGMSGNAKFMRVCEASQEMMRLLHDGITDDVVLAKQLETVKQAYLLSCEGVDRYLAENYPKG